MRAEWLFDIKKHQITIVKFRHRGILLEKKKEPPHWAPVRLREWLPEAIWRWTLARFSQRVAAADKTR